MSLHSVQSFVIENCNGPTIENGLNNVCLHPLSRTFTFPLLRFVLSAFDLNFRQKRAPCKRIFILEYNKYGTKIAYAEK